MAYWQLVNNHVRVFYRQEGKLRSVPRDLLRHLDGQPDHNIQTWVDNYTEQYEGRARSIEADVAQDNQLTKLVDAFCAYRVSKGSNRPMIKSHRALLLRKALPFFLDRPAPLVKPVQWPAVSIQMVDHLVANKVSPEVIKHVNIAMKGWWRWMAQRGHAPIGVELPLETPVSEDNPTPLVRAVTPSQVLDYAAAVADLDMRFLAVAGYFLSLRTQETLALKRRSFIGSDLAASKDCCKVMASAAILEGDVPLYGRFAVNVDMQRVKSGALETPKADSRGLVACFNKDAAQMLIDMVKDCGPDELVLNEWKPDWYIRRWAKLGMAGVCLKDLRRASLLWLGQYTDIRPVALMKHARHKSLETTVGYLRRPEESAEYDANLMAD